jgi:hypothetical protein
MSMGGTQSEFSNVIISPRVDSTASASYNPEQLVENGMSSTRRPGGLGGDDADRLELPLNVVAVEAATPGGERSGPENGFENDLRAQLLAFIDATNRGA